MAGGVKKFLAMVKNGFHNVETHKETEGYIILHIMSTSVTFYTIYSPKMPIFANIYG